MRWDPSASEGAWKVKQEDYIRGQDNREEGRGRSPPPGDWDAKAASRGGGARLPCVEPGP